MHEREAADTLALLVLMGAATVGVGLVFGLAVWVLKGN